MKRIIAMALMLITLLACLAGCVNEDVGIALHKDGTGSVSVSLGLKKDFYDQLVSTGGDPFEGKETVTVVTDGESYITYTETTDYDSYDEIEQALAELTYDTELPVEQIDDEDEAESTVGEPETDNHIFREVKIEKSSGIFTSAYRFHAVMNPQSGEVEGYDVDDLFKVTLTVEMPEKITESKGGAVDGNKIVYDLNNLGEDTELYAVSESNNITLILCLVIVLVVIAVGAFVLMKRKK